MPAASTRTSTFSGPGSGTGMSRSSNRRPGSINCTAFINVVPYKPEFCGAESPYSAPLPSGYYEKIFLSFGGEDDNVYSLLHATYAAMNRRKHRLIEGSETLREAFTPQIPAL